MNIGYQCGVDLFVGMIGLSSRYLGEDNAFREQKGAGALPGLDVDDLVSDYLSRHLIHCRVLSSNQDGSFILVVVNRQKDPVAFFSLFEDHADEAAPSI